MIWLGLPTSNKCAANSRLCGIERNWWNGESCVQAAFATQQLCSRKHRLLFVSALPPKDASSIVANRRLTAWPASG